MICSNNEYDVLIASAELEIEQVTARGRRRKVYVSGGRGAQRKFPMNFRTPGNRRRAWRVA